MLSVSGCRGIVGATVTPEVVRRYAGALVLWIGATPGRRARVVLGRDGRAGGESLAAAARDALLGAGCDVIDLGVAMTPTVGVMVVDRGADAGLVVTASHNPAEWNGLKPITSKGRAPSAEEALRLNQLFADGKTATGTARRGSVETCVDSAEVHVARVVTALTGLTDSETIRRRRFRVALDSVNAAGSVGGRRLLEALGCEVVHLNAKISGVFPHPPEPLEQNLGGLCRAAIEHRTDIAFAQDPDGDRLAIVDERGRYIGEEYTLALCADAVFGSPKMLGRSGAVLAANMSTSRMIDDIAERYGAQVARTPVGEAHVAAAMAQSGAVLGGEGNGGVIWPDVVMIRDSLVAMALVLALMAREGRALGEIVAGLPSYAIEKRKSPLAPGLGARAASALAQAFPGAAADTRDGVRLDFPSTSHRGKAWLHVRVSNTEPILRLIAEAPTRGETAMILDRAQAALND